MSSLPLMFYVVVFLGLFCAEPSLWLFGLNGGRICLGCLGFCVCVWVGDYFIVYFVKILWINLLCFPLSYSIHQCSITLICVKHGLFVSFSSSIAIDRIVRFVIIALNPPSRLSSFPQSMMTFLSVRFSYIFFIISNLPNEYIIIPFTRFPSLILSITFFQNLSPHRLVKAKDDTLQSL